MSLRSGDSFHPIRVDNLFRKLQINWALVTSYGIGYCYGEKMDELLKLGKEVLAFQPFSKLIGAELTVFSPGHVELTIKITDQLK